MEPWQHLNAQKIYKNTVQLINMYGMEKQEKRKRGGQIKYNTDEEKKRSYPKIQDKIYAQQRVVL